MKEANNSLPEPKNWADYCDELRNEYFSSKLKSPLVLKIPERFPNPAATLAAQRQNGLNRIAGVVRNTKK